MTAGEKNAVLRGENLRLRRQKGRRFLYLEGSLWGARGRGGPIVMNTKEELDRVRDLDNDTFMRVIITRPFSDYSGIF